MRDFQPSLAEQRAEAWRRRFFDSLTPLGQSMALIFAAGAVGVGLGFWL